MQIILVWSLYTFTSPTYGSVAYPDWGISLGWCMTAFCLIWIPILAVWKVCKASGGPWQVKQNVHILIVWHYWYMLTCKVYQWCIVFFSHTLLIMISCILLHSVSKQFVHLQRTGVLTWSVIEESVMAQEAYLIQIYLLSQINSLLGCKKCLT